MRAAAILRRSVILSWWAVVAGGNHYQRGVRGPVARLFRRVHPRRATTAVRGRVETLLAALLDKLLLERSLQFGQFSFRFLAGAPALRASAGPARMETCDGVGVCVSLLACAAGRPALRRPGAGGADEGPAGGAADALGRSHALLAQGAPRSRVSFVEQQCLAHAERRPLKPTAIIYDAPRRLEKEHDSSRRPETLVVMGEVVKVQRGRRKTCAGT